VVWMARLTIYATVKLQAAPLQADARNFTWNRTTKD
jgi:hypothetical protein